MSALLTYFWPPVNFHFSLGHTLTQTQSESAADRINPSGAARPENDDGLHTF
jgi:hypothetical protein